MSRAGAHGRAGSAARRRRGETLVAAALAATAWWAGLALPAHAGLPSDGPGVLPDPPGDPVSDSGGPGTQPDIVGVTVVRSGPWWVFLVDFAGTWPPAGAFSWFCELLLWPPAGPGPGEPLAGLIDEQHAGDMFRNGFGPGGAQLAATVEYGGRRLLLAVRAGDVSPANLSLQCGQQADEASERSTDTAGHDDRRAPGPVMVGLPAPAVIPPMDPPTLSGVEQALGAPATTPTTGEPPAGVPATTPATATGDEADGAAPAEDASGAGPTVAIVVAVLLVFVAGGVTVIILRRGRSAGGRGPGPAVQTPTGADDDAEPLTFTPSGTMDGGPVRLTPPTGPEPTPDELREAEAFVRAVDTVLSTGTGAGRIPPDTGPATPAVPPDDPRLRAAMFLAAHLDDGLPTDPETRYRVINAMYVLISGPPTSGPAPGPGPAAETPAGAGDDAGTLTFTFTPAGTMHGGPIELTPPSGPEPTPDEIREAEAFVRAVDTVLSTGPGTGHTPPDTGAPAPDTGPTTAAVPHDDPRLWAAMFLAAHLDDGLPTDPETRYRVINAMYVLISGPPTSGPAPGPGPAAETPTGAGDDAGTGAEVGGQGDPPPDR